MGTTLFTAWYDEVLPEVPGVLQAAALNAIKQAAIEFCARSLAWTFDHDPVTVAATVNLYDYSPPANTQVVQPLEVYYRAKQRIEFKTPAELSALYGDWRLAQAGEPRYVTQVRPSQFYVVPTPVQTDPNGLTLRVAIKPSRAATGLDSMIYEEYLDQITKGAKARLFSMNRVPWMNPNLGAALKLEFEDECREARTRTMKGFGRATPTTQAQFF